MYSRDREAAALTGLRKVVDALLAPDGCPWDRAQTPQSLCDYVVEECFELVEAIRSGNAAEVREELGDVLFLLVFIGRLYEPQGFGLAESLEDAAAKMVRRHPHVFDGVKCASVEELLRNWERIKREEKAQAVAPESTGQEGGGVQSLFASLPKGLPPLLKAHRLHSKAARVGFTWRTDEDALKQLAAEWDEWRSAVGSGDAKRSAEEFGDYLFMLTELARRSGIKANAALDAANRKFLTRFQAMELLAAAQGKAIADMPLEELNGLWDSVKANEVGGSNSNNACMT